MELRRIEHQRRRIRLLGANWQEAFRQLEGAAPVDPYEHQRLQNYAVLALWSARVGGRTLTSAALAYREKADADAAVPGMGECA